LVSSNIIPPGLYGKRLWIELFGTSFVSLVRANGWELERGVNHLILTHLASGDMWELDEFFDEAEGRFKVRIRSLFWVGHSFFGRLVASELFGGIDFAATYAVYTSRLVCAIAGREILWRWDYELHQRRVAHHRDDIRENDQLSNLLTMMQDQHEQFFHGRPWRDEGKRRAKAREVKPWKPRLTAAEKSKEWIKAGPYSRQSDRLVCRVGGVSGHYHGNHPLLSSCWGPDVAGLAAGVVAPLDLPPSKRYPSVYSGGTGVLGYSVKVTLTTREPWAWRDGSVGTRTVIARYRDGQLVSRTTRDSSRPFKGYAQRLTVTRRHLVRAEGGTLGERIASEVHQDGTLITRRSVVRALKQAPAADPLWLLVDVGPSAPVIDLAELPRDFARVSSPRPRVG